MNADLKVLRAYHDNEKKADARISSLEVQNLALRMAASALLKRLYRSHLPSDAALPHASFEWADARAKADDLKRLVK